MAKVWMVAAAAVVGLALLLRPTSHNEEALLTDWSAPPPLPIFVALNVLAGTFRSMADALTPPPIKMLDYAMAYQTTMLAHVCQFYKIPDFLASGPKTVQEIANYMQTKDALRVERLMFALASDDITKLDPSMKRGEEPRFVNTALSATLRTDHPNSVRGMLGHAAQDLYESFGNLDQAFGPNAVHSIWDEVHPDHRGKIWQYFADHTEQEEQFGRAMSSLEGLGGVAMAKDVPFHRFQRFIDIGGSLGHFLHKIMENNPSGKGVLFDRPQVIANAKPLWFEEGGMYHDGTEKRLEMVEGSFFDPSDIPAAQDGDVYFMRYILHDWSNEDCLVILSNLKEKMTGRDATLMIGETSMPDRDTVAVPSMIHKIDMVMLNVFGDALERTPSMWKELLDEAGFEFVAIHPTRSLLHFIEAVPKQ